MVSVTPLQRVSLTAGLTAVRPVQGPALVGPATKAEEILPTDPVLEAVQTAATQRAATLLGLAAPSPQLQKAVAAAAQAAVVRQTGLAPLMADLAEAAGQPTLPPAVRQAAAQVLAQRTPLTPAVQAAAVQDALARSGLLMEARIADGRSPPTPANDLKAALLALRQTLRAVVDDAPAAGETPQAARPIPAPSPSPPPRSDARASGAPGPSLGDIATPAHIETEFPAEPSAVATRLLARTEAALAHPTGTAPLLADLARATGAPNLAPQLRDAVAQVLAQLVPENPALAADTSTLAGPPLETALAEADPPAEPATTAKPSPPGASAVRDLAAAPAARLAGTPILNLETQAALAQAELEAAGQAERGAPPLADLKTVLMALRQTLQAFVSGTPAPPQSAPSASAKLGGRTPPPPFRGGPTQGQPAVEADLPTATGAAARRLLSETDGALARQQLMQLASLPVQRDPAGPATRWMFEVPFATPQGSAVGQFEIARDPPPAGAADAEPTWRARFSLDLSPLGPLHAHVSLSGANVGVALWAEKPQGLAALRNHQPSLTKALLAARLSPDVAVYPGQPVSPQASPGHFVDQAL